MNLFYTPDITENNYTLSEEESKHCRVLRLKEEDVIQLIDGKGGFYTATITDANPKRTAVKITETKKDYGKRNVYLHLAVAPTKNIERFEWFLEKATEIGIDEITPIDCEHSERTVVKTERLNKVLISAMKQSLKAYLPKLNEMTLYDAFIKKQFTGSKYIAHCSINPSASGLIPLSKWRGEGGEVKPHLKNAYTQNSNALILIGPEGDFSKKEIELAVQNNYREVSLGANRLRTETAAVVACHTINILSE